MSGIEVRPVSGHTGADIIGVNLKQRLSDAEVATIRSALLKWKVVFFRDQDITPAEQAAFARRFGQPTPAHPLRDSIEGASRGAARRSAHF
jgi:alpha-ketoglutarate-dependent taurine dioxygenase